jgi:nuclear GTP-binding protein
MSKNKGRKNKTSSPSSSGKAPSTSHSLSLKNRSSSKTATSSVHGAKVRSKSTVKRLQMYRGGKPKRDPSGRIVQKALFQEQLPSGTQARVAPNRQWFNNSRVVTQSSLQKFQAALSTTLADPYQVVMKQTQLPVTLLNEKAKQKRVHILDVESFKTTFGPKAQRKRPSNIPGADDMEALMVHVEQKQNEYDQEKDLDLVREHDGVKQEMMNPLFKAGQSKRIWNELYKVLKNSKKRLFECFILFFKRLLILLMLLFKFLMHEILKVLDVFKLKHI